MKINKNLWVIWYKFEFNKLLQF